MNKNGVTIDCANCRFVESQDSARFDVVVPIVENSTDVAGLARLHCTVSEQSHTIQLAEWQATGVRVGKVDEEIQRRLSGPLGFVADQRLCGNGKLCPSEVVHVVEKVADR